MIKKKKRPFSYLCILFFALFTLLELSSSFGEEVRVHPSSCQNVLQERASSPPKSIKKRKEHIQRRRQNLGKEDEGQKVYLEESWAHKPFKDLLDEVKHGFTLTNSLKQLLDEYNLVDVFLTYKLDYIVRGSTISLVLVPQINSDGTKTRKKIEIHFNLSLGDEKDKNILVIRTKPSLNLGDVDQLSEHLDPNILYRYLNVNTTSFLLSEDTKFMAAFIVSEASEEAIKKANEAGIFIIQLREGEDPKIKINLLNSKQFYPKNFADADLIRSNVEIRRRHMVDE